MPWKFKRIKGKIRYTIKCAKCGKKAQKMGNSYPIIHLRRLGWEAWVDAPDDHRCPECVAKRDSQGQVKP